MPRPEDFPPEDVDALRNIDAKRPLPPALRDRLEAALVTGQGIEMPVAVRQSLEGAIEGAAFRGLDAERPLPAAAKHRLERVIVSAARARTRASRTRRALGSAAAAILVVAASLAVLRGGPEGTRPFAGGSPTPAPSATAIATPAGPGGTVRVTIPKAPTSGVSDDVVPDDRETIYVQPDGVGEPPPFSTRLPRSFPNSAACCEPGRVIVHIPPTPAPPLAFGIVGGDSAQEAGFRAYVAAVNRAGGVRRHELRVQRVSESEPARDVIATVNLSTGALATGDGPPSWASRPLLESLSAGDDVLTGDVFGFSSPPERQAHIAVDAVFPEPAQGATAAVYQASEGAFASAIPAAFEEALEAKQVTVLRLTYTPGDTPILLPATAAFLSLGSDDAAAWAADAAADGYAPERGTAGIYSLLEPGVARVLPEGSRIVGPYDLKSLDFHSIIERYAITGATHQEPGAAVVHGWVTAKSLAYAVWRTGADTPPELRDAVRGLGGFFNGFAPPYAVRPGTNARTPEGILYEVRGGSFHAVSSFITDDFDQS